MLSLLFPRFLPTTVKHHSARFVTLQNFFASSTARSCYQGRGEVSTPYHRQLLVFRHLYSPEAGIQVPAGTVEPDEQFEVAVMREAFEETGLTELVLDCFLGEHVQDMSDFVINEIHRRRFYHLKCQGRPAATWRHEERDPSGGQEPLPIIFEFFWVGLPDNVPPLIAGHAVMLPSLLDRLH